MQIVRAPRASAILFSLLGSQTERRPWLLPANICPIVPVTFLKAGVPFDLVDISAETLHIDLEQVEGRLMRDKFGGLLYAHTYGEPSTPVEFFQSIKSRYPDLLLVDDRCLCVLDLEPDENTPANATLYSTGYAKIMELGYGGYAFLKDTLPYQPASLPFQPEALKNVEATYKQAVNNRTAFVYQDSDWLQTNANMPEWPEYCEKIEAGLSAGLEGRAMLNAIYASRLPDEIQLPDEYQTWRFNIRLPDKQRTLDAIFAAGLFASSHYASLAGIMATGQAPNAEELAGEIVNLFNDHHFDAQKAEQVCDIILETLS